MVEHHLIMLIMPFTGGLEAHWREMSIAHFWGSDEENYFCIKGQDHIFTFDLIYVGSMCNAVGFYMATESHIW